MGRSMRVDAMDMDHGVSAAWLWGWGLEATRTCANTQEPRLLPPGNVIESS